ncbi:DUF2268 domain-containing putative Zn-dependent protease [Oceanicaulis sp. LC35]|uniref:DUF2268 domain-containing putative Zn-dependent protease n=1 Tax=Oceanicaulis sp. LC35 TaxID=3349635 RepID=UPI003F82431C
MFRTLTLALVLGATGSTTVALASQQVSNAQSAVTVAFEASETHDFTASERAAITQVLDAAYQTTKADFPHLTDAVTVEIHPIERPGVDALGGVTGRAQRPGVLILEISATYPGGLEAAAHAGLMRTGLHEMHHLARGWTIEDNQFGYGIAIAAANEGLAEIYAEHYEGRETAYAPLDAETFNAWAEEIRALPYHADYGQWMFAHPDGREAIGYRTGAELVRQAMAHSGLGIVEISARSPDEIWRMAGFEDAGAN